MFTISNKNATRLETHQPCPPTPPPGADNHSVFQKAIKDAFEAFINQTVAVPGAPLMARGFCGDAGGGG